MKRFLTALTASALLATPANANAKTQPVLRAGSHGAKVSALQWLLAGHRPNVFTQVKGTFPHKPNGLLGQRTADAITAYKYRLGYPQKYVRPVAGPLFFDLLEGKRTRPAAWVVTATARVKAIEAATPSKLAVAIKAYELTQLGVSEQPLGSNWGPQVSVYQSDTGAYHAAWCVSFQQHSFRVGGYGHFANATASVYYAADYYAARSMLHAKPKIGALVLFIVYDRFGHRVAGTGHIGYVVKLTATGFVSIEGNASNRVLERFHVLGERPMTFAYLPGVA